MLCLVSILKQLPSPLLEVRPDGELGQVERYIWWQRLGYCYVVPTMEHGAVDLVENCLIYQKYVYS